MTERSTGSRECQYTSGCLFPVPQLRELDSLALFLMVQCRTQWRVVAGMSGLAKTGLDYGAVERVAALHGVEMSPFLLERIQVAEQAVLLADRELRARASQEAAIRPIPGGDYVS